MRAYPVSLVRNETGGVLLRFPDVPEAVTCGRSEEEALGCARDLLEAILDGYAAEGRDLPEPSRIDGATLVSTDRYDGDKWFPLFYSGPV